MNGTTHMAVGGMTGGLLLAAGISSGTVSFGYSGYEIFPVVTVVAAAIGGLSPDVDMERSSSGAFLRKLLRVAIVLSAGLLLLVAFVPRTGIGFLDRAIGFGSGLDRQIPIFLAVFCIIILFVVEKSSHRGFTHTLVGFLTITAPLIFMFVSQTHFVGADIVVSAQVGFSMGWLSHMVIDTFNYPGTPWLWPVVQKHFNIMRIKSGSSEEGTFLVMCIGVFAVCYALIFF